MKEKQGYAGSIKNSGAQYVKAPFAAEKPKSKTTVTTGSDLRTGKGK